MHPALAVRAVSWKWTGPISRWGLTGVGAWGERGGQTVSTLQAARDEEQIRGRAGTGQAGRGVGHRRDLRALAAANVRAHFTRGAHSPGVARKL